MKKKLFTILTIVFGTLFMVSCGGNDDPTPPPPTAEVNQDILGIMQNNYLFALPQNYNLFQDAESFFASLLDKREGYDYYKDNGQIYTYSRISPVSNQAGVVYDPGFEYAINKYEGGKTYYVVLYVKPGTPVANGEILSRGVYITTVNNVAVTAANAPTLLYDAYKDGKDVNVKMLTPKITSEFEATIKPVANYRENPLHTATMPAAGTQKVGYILYNHFSSGPAANDFSYENALANKLTEFKNAGVRNLVFDVRYNSGGSITAIQSLASALIKSSNAKDVFMQQQFRADLPTPFKAVNFVEKTNDGNGSTAIPKLGDQLDNIYIITGQATAGAPEALIYSLKSYIPNIIVVGEKTKGRNIATASTQDVKKQWNLRIAFLYMDNKDKQHDYASGITPNTVIQEVQENAKLTNTLLGPLGTKEDIILGRILDMISGQKSASIVDLKSASVDRELKTSLFRRPGANETTVELPSQN